MSPATTHGAPNQRRTIGSSRDTQEIHDPSAGTDAMGGESPLVPPVPSQGMGVSKSLHGPSPHDEKRTSKEVSGPPSHGRFVATESCPDIVFDLEHRLRIFVFHVAEDGIHYLLLRHKPVTEWPLGPVIGPISPGDQIRDAALRQVQREIGLARPVHLIEMAKPTKELFGADGGLIEWPVAWQAGSPHEEPATIDPGPTIGECRWLPFEAAFQQIGTKRDRDTLVRLQLRLS